MYHRIEIRSKAAESGITTSMSGEELLERAAAYGTPLYVYDGDLILKRYSELCEFFPWPQLKIFYAMKANYNYHILELLWSAGARIDAVSPGDVLLALRAGYSPEEILYTPNHITLDEMKRIQELGILQNVESIPALINFGRAFPGADVCLRFNTDVVAGEHKYVATAGEASKFGIMVSEVDRAVDIASDFSLKIVGLHEHTGSGISDTDAVMKSMENLLAIATPGRFTHLRFIDFGGGFKVPYTPDEKRIDYRAFGERVVSRFSRFCDDFGKELELYFEPGKYLVAEAGYLLAEVNTLKEKKHALIAGVNSGFTQLMRPVLYDAYHHILNLSNPSALPEMYDIYGNICEAGDYFGRERMIAMIREGDILAVLNAGAYCYTMGSIYNLRPMPSEVLVLQGREDRVTRGFSYEEMVDLIVSRSEPETPREK